MDTPCCEWQRGYVPPFRTPGSVRGTKQEVGAIDRGSESSCAAYAPRFGFTIRPTHYERI